MIQVFSRFSKTLIWDRASFRFAIGVWLGLSFSIAVILSTIGIMDGFISTMKGGLKKSNGDLYFYSRSGFFSLGEEVYKAIDNEGVQGLSASIESQAFVVFEGKSKGVSVKGIEGDSYSELTGMKIQPEKDSLLVGAELFKTLNLKEGDDIVLVLAKGNAEMEGLPLLKRFKVQGIIDHGIYQKDLRFVYMDRKDLSQMLGVGEKVNMVALNLPPEKQKWEMEKREQEIKDLRYKLEDVLGIDFRVKPYWYDYGSLLEAVEIEKYTIGIILQIIVVISIFNVLSFVTFLNEKKSREIFLFQALGMSSKYVRKSWVRLMFVLWFSSCLFSIVLVRVFNYLLNYLSFLNLPGEVYYMDLSRLTLNIGWDDYLLVYFSALFWLMLIVAFSLYRMKRKSLLYGLRKEFS
ncbi:MAG: hypothetical protein NXH75_11535 [Halobacteriovoraceae bacterium]|nr:hypothetical protein [Halobacteriovoraceae bacterium]